MLSLSTDTVHSPILPAHVRDELADSWFDRRRYGSDRPPRPVRDSDRPGSSVPPASIDPEIDDWFR